MESEGLSHDQTIGTYSTETLQSSDVGVSNQQRLDSNMAWVATYQLLTKEVCVQFQANSCGTYGTGTDFFLSALLLSPATIIPPMFHTHSFMHKQCYTILASDSVIKWHT